MIETVPAPRDEFYIGYEEGMPAGIARRVAMAIVMFACGAAVGIAVALVAQERLAASRFEFGVVKTVSGILRRAPYPSLEVAGRRVWLVGPGKFGADQVLAGIPDGPVIVEGSAIQRGENHMLEAFGVRPGYDPGPTPVRTGSDPGPTPVRTRSDPGLTPVGVDSDRGLTLTSLVGEIVDSKCFLGVMNPGEGTVHRDCARRCISGGIPPMLLVRDDTGREELVVLVTANGRPVGRDVASLAGRPVRVTGRLARDGDVWLLYADAAAFRPN